MIKINLTYDCITFQKPLISAIIKRCIEATLAAEGITVPCEINVFVTNDKGIRAINQASRDIDKATDVLSFPMFQLEAGNPPEDWDEFLDPETDMCPLGDMAISLERAIAQAKEFGQLRADIAQNIINFLFHNLVNNLFLAYAFQDFRHTPSLQLVWIYTKKCEACSRLSTRRMWNDPNYNKRC